MLTIRSSVGVAFVALFGLLIDNAAAVPQNRGGRGGGGRGQTQAQALTLQQQAAEIPQGVSQATDGSTILDTNATVKYEGYIHSAVLSHGTQGRRS